MALQTSNAGGLDREGDPVGVAVVDDDENQRLLIKRILNQTPEFDCVGEYATGDAALVGIPRSAPKIVLLDIRMRGMSGIECARRLKALLPRLIIVMVTVLDEIRIFHQAQEAGANGYLLKPFSVGQFVATLTLCLPHPAKMPHTVSATAQERVLLSSRECAVAELVAKGFRNKEIAAQLHVSEFVVAHVLQRIGHKLHASNRAEVAARWVPATSQSDDT